MKVVNLKEVVYNLESSNYPFIIKISDNKKNTFSVIAEEERWHSAPEDEYYDWAIIVDDNGTKKTAYIDAYFGDITLELC